MLLTEPADLKPLFQRLLAGEIVLYGWGAVRQFRFYDWRLPWPYAAILDNSPQKWGTSLRGIEIVPPDHLKTLDPTRHVIMVLPLYEPAFSTIVRQIEAYGPFTIVKFMPAEEIARMLDPSEGPSSRDLRIADFFRFGHGREALLRYLLARTPTGSRADVLAENLRRSAPRPRGLGNIPGRVALAIGRLNLGGAERQIVALAGGFRKAGWEVSLLADGTEPPESRHYVADLKAHGIDYRIFEFSDDPDYLIDCLDGLPAEAMEVLWRLPSFALWATLRYALFLRDFQPDLVIGYLDYPNVTVGIAALLTGAPRILLSGRNYNPSHFPLFYEHTHADFRWLYQALTTFPQVQLSTNATLCSRDYAEWLGIEPHRVVSVPNCLSPDAAREPTPAEITLTRKRYGLKADQQLILGVFRLSPEKEPQVFLDVIERLLPRHPRLRAIICGTGNLTDVLADEIDRHGLSDVITLAGPIAEVGALMKQATIMLHTARFEGMPNALLEAQHFGLPVVTTIVGGTPDCLASDLLPYARQPGDIDGLVASCEELLGNPAALPALSARIRSEVRQRFSVERLVANTLEAAGIMPAMVDA